MGEWSARYLGSRVRATNTKTFTFERPAELDYLPGQFFFVMLNPSTEPLSRPLEHHFSFSSSPTEPVVEFTTRMTGSDFKNRLDGLPAGMSVHLAGPDGAFVLQPGMHKVACLCGGIGITPARSMVRWVEDSEADVDITVLYANRDLADAAFSEEFGALASDRVRVVNVLSHPEPGWSGRTGHVDAAAVRDEIPDWAERDFFVSGAAVMVDAFVKMLIDEVGIDRARVSSEHFPGYTS